MAKSSGLGQALIFNGVDLSNDVGSLSGVHGGPALLDQTGINKYAHERIGGRLDGALGFAPFFNPSGSHATLALLPSADIHILYATGSTVGVPAAGLVGKQGNYDGTDGTDGGLGFAVQATGNGYGLEWADLLTAGARTDTAATSGTALDFGATFWPSINLTSASAANPTVVTTSSPHGMASNDSVNIAGTNKAALNGDWKVTVTGASTYTVPVDLTGGAATGGAMIRTSTSWGLAAYHQTITFTGTSNTPKLQHSADNGVVDTWSDISGAAFTAITAAPDYQRIATTTTTIVRRYVRLNSVGTFNPSTFWAAMTRHPAGAAG